MKKFTKKGILNTLGSHSKNGTKSSSGNSKCRCQEEKRKPSRWERFILKMKDINEYVIPALKESVGMFVSIVTAFKPQRVVYMNYAR